MSFLYPRWLRYSGFDTDAADRECFRDGLDQMLS